MALALKLVEDVVVTYTKTPFNAASKHGRWDNYAIHVRRRREPTIYVNTRRLKLLMNCFGIIMTPGMTNRMIGTSLMIISIGILLRIVSSSVIVLIRTSVHRLLDYY